MYFQPNRKTINDQKFLNGMRRHKCCLYFPYFSVCILSVPPNSHIVQQNGTQSTFGVDVNVECIPCYKLNGSQAKDNVNTCIRCNSNGIFDLTPTCEQQGNDTSRSL